MVVTVQLAGISRLAGGQDGWKEKLHAVYNFSVQCQELQPQAFFSPSATRAAWQNTTARRLQVSWR
jgi:hypothetical protein